ncbi:ABC branched-chain amino acid transporter, ATPase component (plasmid) [Rhodococcus jostii RHA1]|uniref:ABC branched-chain amino acid transporter, ATPase component n=1 Tax=Rhodococcus jostii (strain RHA1) TaxID=101510 RepID=Q0RXF1_RHOJR|nr:ABC transporter ATP-binding protein [Rhodococcus jostii]ABH00035.1 ABC branched-chain amino acid transporter, ATPase component [Rhodococcus jostii RHA1]
MSALECRDFATGYVKQRPCVRDIDLTVEPGEITCLLGPNGAGKTTLLMALAGLLPRFSGDVEVDGHPVRSGRPRDAVRAGMVLVPDDRALFRQLSTVQNLRLAVRQRARRGTAVDEIIGYFPSLAKRLRVDAGRLSGGEQQMLAIGRAVLQKPKVMLIDELSMGLAPVIVDEILAVLRRLTDEAGMAVVLVEQHVHLALGIADRAAVLVHGSVALRESTATLRADPSLVERAYLGIDAVGAGPS